MKIKIFYNVIMSSKYIKKLEFNQYQKSVKTPFIYYADLECITEKINGCKSNPESLSITKESKHILSGFSMPTLSSLTSMDCMKKFCEFLRENPMKIINFKIKK